MRQLSEFETLHVNGGNLSGALYVGILMTGAVGVAIVATIVGGGTAMLGGVGYYILGNTTMTWL